MKKDEEMNSEPIITKTLDSVKSESVPNNRIANLSATTFYEQYSVTKPAEILMSLILPTVSNQLKYHQELMKLKESNT